MKERSFRVRYALTLLLLFLAGALFLFLDRYGIFDYILVCPMHLLGIYCPTCGLTRAAHALLALDFRAAFLYHPLWPLLATVALYYAAFGLAAAIRNDGRLLRRATVWPLYSTLAALAAFFILRNILLFLGIDMIGDFS